MSITPEQTTSDLVTTLTGHAALKGWHVLVAYKEDALNSMLESRHAELKDEKSTVPPFDSEYEDPLSGNQGNVTFKLKLGAPKLQITTSNAEIDMNFALEGQYVKDGKATPLPSGLVLRCSAWLITTSGAAEKSKAGTVVSFADNEASKNNIALDLQEPTVTILDSTGKVFTGLHSIGTALTSRVAELGLEYNILTVSSASDSSRSESLQPSKMVMTTIPGSSNKTPGPNGEKVQQGILLMWIAISGLTFEGDPHTEETPLQFKPNGTAVSPIPSDGGNAMVYVSNSALYAAFVKKRLESLGYTNVTYGQLGEAQALFKKTKTTGLLFKAKPPSKVVNVPGYHVFDDHLDDFTFNMNSADANFLLDRNKEDCTVRLKYEVKDVEFRSSENRSYGSRIPTVVKLTTKGKATFTFAAKGDGKWSSSSDESLGIQYGFPPTFETSYDPDKTDIWDHIFKLQIDHMHPDVNNISVAIPEVKIDFGALDLFLTTNILTPGKHVFKLREIPDNLYFPWDMMLLGDVATK